MKRHGNLFEKIAAFDNLLYAARKAFRGDKKFTARGSEFYFHLESELLSLEKDLLSGTYRPKPYRTFKIYEPKERKICAADFRDRVLHHAICNIIEPIFDRSMIFDTYACRKNKGAHAALKRARAFSRRFRFFLKCDIRGYFETIDHQRLKTVLARKIKDPDVLNLLHIIIDHPVPNATPGKGIPIGNLTSQVFANIYLGELDHLLKDRMGIKGYLRYMDDFLVFGPDRLTLREWLSEIYEFLSEDLLLELKEKALILAPVTQGISFLGFRVFPGTIRLSRRNLVRFRQNVRKAEEAYKQGMIDEAFLISSVGSMIAHISHADTRMARKAIFSDNDLG